MSVEKGKKTRGGGRPRGKSPDSLQGRVLAFILARPQGCTLSEVVAAMSPGISAASAVGLGRQLKNRYTVKKRPTEELVKAGKSLMVTNALHDLKRQGRVAHLGRALYGPSAPKLFNPAESA